MTAHEALSHPFVAGEQVAKDGKGSDLLPVVKKNFNARRTLHAAIDTVRAINKLREGQGGMMDGVVSNDPAKGAKPLGTVHSNNDSGVGGMGLGDDGAMDTSDSGYAIAGASASTAPNGGAFDTHMRGVERTSGQGQTEAQIEAQKRKIAETTKGLWSAGAAKISGR